MQDMYSNESSDDQWQSQELPGRKQHQQQAHVKQAGPDTEDSGDSEDDEEPASLRPGKRQKKSAADARPAALQQATGTGGSNQAAQLKVRRQREQAFNLTGRAALLQWGCAYSTSCWLLVRRQCKSRQAVHAAACDSAFQAILLF